MWFMTGFLFKHFDPFNLESILSHPGAEVILAGPKFEPIPASSGEATM